MSGIKGNNSVNTKIIPGNKLFIDKYIQNNPGIYLRQICKDLGLATGNTQYHLFILEKEGKISSKKIGQHRHYYNIEINDERHKLILAYLRYDTTKDIIIFLIEHRGSTQSDIAQFKHFSSATISWHMSRLIKMGIVFCIMDGKFKRYFIISIETVIYCIKKYMPNLWDNLSYKLIKSYIQVPQIRKKNE